MRNKSTQDATIRSIKAKCAVTYTDNDKNTVLDTNSDHARTGVSFIT